MKPDSDLLAPLTTLGYQPVARLRPRHAREISGSPWGIGCETLDRDYVDFAHTGPHLGDLGAKHVRLQAGWAKCEPTPGGPYGWAWLDTIIESCLEQGVKPWLQLSYGNPGYEGGGGIGLAQGIPVSEEALAAWDRWARALAERYGDRVTHWEVWNEPDLFGAVTPEAYKDFFIRTAIQVRAARPDAKMIGLVLCHKAEFAEDWLAALAASGRADLLDEISFHLYPQNPDHSIEIADKIKTYAARHGISVPLRQGETGAPSDAVQVGALSGLPWTERKQAAWDLRRLLAHHARGYAMSLFQLGDMYYAKQQGGLFEGRNPKGLLCILPDKSVAYRKPAYFAAQHIFSMFDDAYPLAPLPAHPGRFPISTAAYAWQRTADTSPNLVAWWRNDGPPDVMAPPLTVVGLDAIPLREPVLVEFLSGIVFAPPKWFASSPEAAWAMLPCSDTPLALAERDSLPLRDL